MRTQGEMGDSTLPGDTWSYKHAFRLKDLQDVPSEFLRPYQDTCLRYGKPTLAFFSPASEQCARGRVRRSLPRIVLVFSEALALLTLEKESREPCHVHLPRAQWLGYGLAEFLLDCWFTVYPAAHRQFPLRLSFPSRALSFYTELAHALWQSHHDLDTHRDDSGIASRPLLPANLPLKLGRFLATRSEIGPLTNPFVQAAAARPQTGELVWPNLLMAVAPGKIVVLSDQFGRCFSAIGLEATFLFLDGIRRVKWREQVGSQLGAIEFELNNAAGRGRRLQWQVLRTIKPNANDWIAGVNRLLSRASEQVKSKAATERER